MNYAKLTPLRERLRYRNGSAPYAPRLVFGILFQPQTKLKRA